MGPFAEYEIARPVAEDTDTEIKLNQVSNKQFIHGLFSKHTMGSLVEINTSVASSGAIVMIYWLTMGDTRRG